MTYRARDIANWFLAWADVTDDAELTNLKLQKLLYYAQGHHLGRKHAPLFRDQIQAWSHGPVVPNVYHQLKGYGGSPIDVDAEVPDDFDWSQFRDVEDDLIRVWNTYGQYSGWALRNMTHEESPWLSTFQDGERNLVISKKDMGAFFSGN